MCLINTSIKLIITVHIVFFLNDIYFIRHLHSFALRMYVALKSHKYENALARMFYYCCDILMMRVVNDAHAYHGLQYVFTRI